MDSKIQNLAQDISGLIKNFIKNEVSEYKENYDHMLNSPLFKSLRNEVSKLREENLRLSQKMSKNNIELVIRDESPDTEYEIDRKYKDVNDTVEEDGGDEDGGLGDFPQEEEGGLESPQEEDEGEEFTEEEEEGEEFTEEEEGEEFTEEEDGEEEDGGLGSPQEEEEGGLGSPQEEDEGEEFTEEEEDGGLGSPQEEGGLGQAPEAQLSNEVASESPQEEEEEEEVIEFEYKGVQYFVTDEVNGDIYENVDDDIGDLVGKIKNKNVILF